MPEMTARLSAVAIQATNSLDFLERAFSLYAAGTTFTVQRPGLDLSRYPGLAVADRQEALAGGGWGKLSFVPEDSDRPAQILFSSGTEGLPKPIVLSPRNISDVVRRLNTAMDVDETIREYIGVPVTYSFGLGRVRAVSAAGGKFFLPDRFDPAEIRRMLEADEINAISAVPTLWRIVLANPNAIGAAGARVRWIEIGSQYMSGEEKAALKRLFPNARIVQHYGLTEASRTTFLDISTADEDVLESVGHAAPPAEIRIGGEGEICIRGDHVALGQLTEDGSIAPLVGKDGWLHTKDRGEIRDGVLYYLGRLDDQMNIAGVNVNAENLEREIVDLCNCAGHVAVTSIADPLRGDAVVVAVDAAFSDRAPLIEKAAEIALRKMGVNQAGGLHLFEVDEIPVTGTGKIQRKELRKRFEARPERTSAASPGAVATDLTEGQERIAEAWRKVVGQVAISADESFYDIGGDSLSAVQIGLVMESGFAQATVRATLEGRSLREVADTPESQGSSTDESRSLPNRTTATWSVNIARALMVMAVLTSHWGPGFFQRLGIGREADYVLGGIYRMGTEGFATVFGFGLGFFYLPRYASDKSAVHRRLRLSLVLVLSGLTLIACVHLLLLALEGRAIGGLEVGLAFYNVLAFYVLAFATAPVWLWYLGRGSVTVRALGVAVAGPVLMWIFRSLFPDRVDGVLEWLRLLTVANYSYFLLLSLIFPAIAIGYWFSGQKGSAQASRTLLGGGVTGMALATLIGIDVMGLDAFATGKSPFFTSFLGNLFYFSLVVALVGSFDLVLKSWHSFGTVRRGILQILIVIGGLALPIFAFHGIVIPIKDILVVFGLPGIVALGVPMGAFLAVMLYLGWRLRRMYFG